MELITLQNAEFTYAYADKPAMRDVTLEIEQGRLYGVVGPNGSGKSTLCNVIRGTIPHFHPGGLSGAVTIFGRDTRDWRPAELSNAIGYVFQNPFTQISGIKDNVFEEIAFGLENLGTDPDAIIAKVSAVVEEVGLESMIEKNPNELSGGQRQLVAFASIIAMDADVIVIDEPTSQLDPETSEEVFKIIDSLKRRGKTIILVEHKVDLLAEYADQLIVMKHGRVIRSGPARDVLTSDEIADAEIRRPEVTELGLALQRAGKPLGTIPITRGEAKELVTARLKEADRADSAQ